MAGPIGWIFTLLMLAIVIGCVWVGAKVASSIATALVDDEITIGRDGIDVALPDRPRRFIDFREVASCAAMGDRALIVLAGGGRVAVPSASPDEASSLAGILEELRWRAHCAVPADARASAVLTRNESPLPDWLRKVASLLRDGGVPAYRGTPIDGDALADVLASPHASIDQTLGAAAALGASGNQGLVERVRIASQATADPDLRAALEEAALGCLRESTVKHLMSLPRWTAPPDPPA